MTRLICEVGDDPDAPVIVHVDLSASRGRIEEALANAVTHVTDLLDSRDDPDSPVSRALHAAPRATRLPSRSGLARIWSQAMVDSGGQEAADTANTHMLAAMSPRPPGRPLILDQLRLALAGVEEASDQEVVARWLEGQSEETKEVFRAALFIDDHDSRDDRASRWFTLRRMQASYDTDWGWLVPGGSEAVWLYGEAQMAFINGLYLASLLCSHAACERVLAACLQAYEDRLDKGWRNWWGLGTMIREAKKLGLIDPPLVAELVRVNELRKVSAHYKPPLEPNSIHMRAFAELPETSAESDDDTLNEVMEADALLGMKVATELLRGDQGFARVRFWDSRSGHASDE